MIEMASQEIHCMRDFLFSIIEVLGMTLLLLLLDFAVAGLELIS